MKFSTPASLLGLLANKSFFDQPTTQSLETCVGVGLGEAQSSGISVCRDLMELLGDDLNCEEFTEIFTLCLAFPSTGQLCDPNDEIYCSRLIEEYNSMLQKKGCNPVLESSILQCRQLLGDNMDDECILGLDGCVSEIKNEIDDEKIQTCDQVQESLSACAQVLTSCNLERKDDCEEINESLNTLMRHLNRVDGSTTICPTSVYGRESCFDVFNLTFDPIKSCVGEGFDSSYPHGSVLCKDVVSNVLNGGDKVSCDEIRKMFAQCINDDDYGDYDFESRCDYSSLQDCEVMVKDLNSLLVANECEVFEDLDEDICHDIFHVSDPCTVGVRQCSSETIRDAFRGSITDCNGLKSSFFSCVREQDLCDHLSTDECSSIFFGLFGLLSLNLLPNEICTPPDLFGDQAPVCFEAFGLPYDPSYNCVNGNEDVSGMGFCKKGVAKSIETGDLISCEQITKSFTQCVSSDSICDSTNALECNAMIGDLNELLASGQNCTLVEDPTTDVCVDLFGKSGYDFDFSCLDDLESCTSIVLESILSNDISTCEEVKGDLFECFFIFGFCESRDYCMALRQDLDFLLSMLPDTPDCRSLEESHSNICSDVIDLPVKDAESCYGNSLTQSSSSGAQLCMDFILSAFEIQNFEDCESMREAFVECIKLDGSCEVTNEAECVVVSTLLNLLYDVNFFCEVPAKSDVGSCKAMFIQPNGNNSDGSSGNEGDDSAGEDILPGGNGSTGLKENEGTDTVAFALIGASIIALVVFVAAFIFLLKKKN